MLRTRILSSLHPLPGGGEKKIRFVHELDRIPFRSGPGRELIRQIERAREEASSLIRPGDPLGIFRRLYLDERVRPPLAFGSVSGPREPWPADPAEWRGLGWVHLFSASGIHLIAWGGIVFGMTFRGLRAIGIDPIASLAWARGLTGASWLGAWLLAGARPGMLRPLIVLGIRSQVRDLGGRSRMLAPILAACALDALWAWLAWWVGEPGISPVPLGQEHYALAVAGGLLAADLARKKFRRGGVAAMAGEHAAMAVGSWLFTWPLGGVAASPGVSSLGIFLVAPLTPLLSLLSIPWLGGCLHPLGLGVLAFEALGVRGLFASLVVPLLGASSHALEYLHSALLSSGLSLAVVPAAAALLALPSSLFALALGLRGRLVLLGLMLLLRMTIGIGRGGPDAGPSRVIQLDVGQGDAALIVDREGGTTGLIDTGSRRALGRWGWLRVLASSGIGSLDYVLLTHPDEDHAGGLETLKDTLTVGCTVRVEEDPGAGDCFPFPWAETSHGRARANGRMLGVYVRLSDRLGGQFAYANLGDADRASELAFLPWLKGLHDPAVPLVFKASHHGSRTSSDPALIAGLSPKEVWFSSGVGNPHGHPARSVMENWRQAGVPVRLTAREGGIQAGP